MAFSIVTTTTTQHFGNNSFSFNAPEDQKRGCFQNACVLFCVLTMQKVQINKFIEPSLLVSTGSAHISDTDEHIILLHSPTEKYNPRKGEKISTAL